MKEEVCTKHFPKRFAEHTIDNADGYPVYRRRDDGRIYVNANGFHFDNTWVVPYNPYLCLKYDAHINVEICTSIRSVKYLYKYVYKGTDQAQLLLVPVGNDAPQGVAPQAVVDEIRNFQDGRYMSSMEAAYRLLIFLMHGKAPTVLRLALHLENFQTVGVVGGNVERALRNSRTTLTEWLRYNHERKLEYERDLVLNPQAVAPPCLAVLYPDFCATHRWDKSGKTWGPRQRGKPPVARIYSCLQSSGERFYLRLLLLRVPGATSWEHLRTTGHGTPTETIWPTFKDACQAHGLLDNDEEWEATIREAGTFATASSLRALFATLLAFNGVHHPAALWDTFLANMVDDFLHEARQRHPGTGISANMVSRALRDVDRHLTQLGRALHQFAMPAPGPIEDGPQSSMLAEERGKYDPVAQALKRDNDVPRMNIQQRHIYGDVMAAVDGDRALGTAFFIDGLGGAGKTFLYGCLLSTVRADDRVALSVASSGIAALLLEGGRTGHSRFKIPVGDVCETSTCGIPAIGELAELIGAADIIVWDEAPMCHRHVFEAVDRTLKDVLQVPDVLFGGKVFVMGGDFRQILPIVPKGTRGQIVRAALNTSPLWLQVRVYNLHVNMRVLRLRQEDTPDAEARAMEVEEFARFLKDVGDGEELLVYKAIGADSIRIPDDMCCPSGHDANVEDLIQEVFGDLGIIHDLAGLKRYMTERAILTPKNVDVDTVNELVAERLRVGGPDVQAEKRTYVSADSVQDTETAHMWPTEFLNTQTFSGMPPHKLTLQVGAPIMLLRNMTGGLANGTRLIVTHVMERIFQAEVMTGPAQGTRVCIPRLRITPSDAGYLPFSMSRLQFPVRPAFAMTINKSQGQSLDTVGIYLPKPVFGHGQLYVALSRATRRAGVKVLVHNGWRPHTRNDMGEAPEGVYTSNVVYKEVFRQ